MAEILRVARSTIKYHLKKFEKLGYAEHKYYLWFPIYKGGGGRENLVGSERGGERSTVQWLKDRAHNIKVKYPILETPNDIIFLKGWKINDKLKNNIQWSKRFGGVLQVYTTKSVIFQLPILRFENSEIAMAEAARIGDRLAQRLMDEVPGLKLGGNTIHDQAQAITQHHAIPNDPYAKWMYKNNITYSDALIDVDCSESPELEFTDKEKGHIHHERYIDHTKDIITKECLKPSELMKTINQTHNLIQEIASAQINTQIQLQSLIKLLQPNKKVKKSKKNNEIPEYIL